MTIMIVITVDQFAKAIKDSIGYVDRPLKEEEAKAMAMYVLNFFEDYGEYTIDNILEPEDRDVFYMLEDVGLLTTEREEVTLYDGREWRINYWVLKKDKIFELAKAPKEELKIIKEEASVYDELPDEIWHRNKIITDV